MHNVARLIAFSTAARLRRDLQSGCDPKIQSEDTIPPPKCVAVKQSAAVTSGTAKRFLRLALMLIPCLSLDVTLKLGSFLGLLTLCAGASFMVVRQ